MYRVIYFRTQELNIIYVKNDNQNESISINLIIHVGSLMEEDSEQGLAHFIEHLGFKSTKSFGHYELVKFLESLGASYGPDLNASTHLLETIF
jgi:zinc protease